MATNELPEKPSDADFAFVRERVQDPDERYRITARVLRYLLAEHDAKPAPVAVPEDVVRDAKTVVELDGFDAQSVNLACFVLSLVPEPVVEWEKDFHNPACNTVWTLMRNGGEVAYVTHELREDDPAWRVEAVNAEGVEVREWFPDFDLAAAKSRAEELCGVSSKKGG